MNCPHCQSDLLPNQDFCSGCGFSASAISDYLGRDWVRLERITDVSSRLTLAETRHLETVLDHFERRFPQCFIAVFVGVLPEALTLPDLGFWMINHGAFQTQQISRRNDFAAILLVDPVRGQMAISLGYALEHFLPQSALQPLLKAQIKPLQKGHFGRVLEDVSVGIEVMLRNKARLQPQSAERAPEHISDAGELGLHSLRKNGTTSGQPHLSSPHGKSTH